MLVPAASNLHVMVFSNPSPSTCIFPSTHPLSVKTVTQWIVYFSAFLMFLYMCCLSENWFVSWWQAISYSLVLFFKCLPNLVLMCLNNCTSGFVVFCGWPGCWMVPFVLHSTLFPANKLAFDCQEAVDYVCLSDWSCIVSVSQTHRRKLK